ncbi:MAG: penicillin-binding protein activator [Nitrospirae bacterium]|nr:penicillin-binding protein activator [Nitrospirota bacterium]
MAAAGRAQAASSGENQALATLEKAKGLIDTQQHAAAVTLLQSFLTATPRSSVTDRAYLLLGAVLVGGKSPKDAIPVLERLLTEHPGSSYANRARLQLGQAHAALGHYDAAQRYYTDAKNLSQDVDTKREALRWSAEAGVLKGEFVRAVQAWLEDMTIGPPNELAEGRERIRAVIKDRMDQKALVRLRDLYPNKFPGDLALVRLIELATTQGDEQAAEQNGRLLLNRFPNNEYASTATDILSSLKSKVKSSSHVIVVLVPQSGKTAPFGTEAVHGIRLALDKHKETDGGTIGLVVADSESTSRAALTDLIDEHKPLAVIGPLLSREVQMLAGFAEQAEVPFITPGATLPDIRRLGNYLFSTALTHSAQAHRIADYATSRMEQKRFAILHPDTAYGKELARLFTQEVTQHGGETVVIESYKETDTDFGVAIRRMKGEDLKRYGTVTTEDLPKGGTRLVYVPGFDAVFIPGTARQIPLIATQLAFYDIKVPLLGSNTWHSAELVRLGERSLEGSVFVDGFVPERMDPLIREFVDTYQHRFQAAPSIFAAQAYDAARLVLEALRQGATSAKAVREHLGKSTNLPSLAGPAAFSPSGTLDRPVSVLQVKHGRFVPLD